MRPAVAPAPRNAWHGVVAEDLDALPEHCPEWIDAICAWGPFEDASRYYRFPDGRAFVLPLLRRTGPAGTGGWFLSPPPAWGFGGLIGEGLDEQVVRHVVEDLRSMRAARIWIRPDPTRAAAWSAATGPDVLRIPRCAHVLDLHGGMEAAEARCNKSTRNGYRKARKSGVTVSVHHDGSMLPLHYDLYETSVVRWAEQQHEPLWLARWRARRRDPLQKLQAMADALGKGFCQVIAFHDGRAIASNLLLLGNTAHETRGAMDRERAQRVRAGELLQITSIQLAIEAGCSRFHLGESGRSASLSSSKEKFGAVATDYDEIRIERVPLSRADLAARSVVKRAIGFKDA